MPQSIAEQLQSIPMSPSLSQSLGRAQDFAREQSHRALMLEHLLLALTEDPDASGVLRACNVDIDKLGADVSGYLGGLLEVSSASEVLRTCWTAWSDAGPRPFRAIDYRLSQRRAKPSRPCGRKMMMRMKVTPSGIR
jgi:ATP-dependent Clp protease ATP-binding subunit ClpA